ncbi:MAG: S1-like domain-containing RNA-binding protein [Bacteroidota bacterium]|nr:S1-like domain-containing RNA-binding protein [Bacteroidota bacterium]
MASIGTINTLRVMRILDFGAYLDGDNLGDILLPIKDVPENCKPEDLLDVFIYMDSEDRIIATTQQPKAMVGDIAMLEVIATSKVGAFLNWGLLKDLLVPFSEQGQAMEVGKSYLVYVYLDEKTNRLAASAKLDNFLDLTPKQYAEEQEVGLIITFQSELGYKAAVNGLHSGILYANEIYQALKPGQKIVGYIKKIRSDGKLDLILQKPGFEKIDQFSDQLLKELEKTDGFLAYNDKSDPEEIRIRFAVSKKVFKKAVGSLYKKKKILLEDGGIRLIQ